MGMNGKQLRFKNELEALTWVHDFGWIRATELGYLMWPDAQYSTKNAQRVAKKLHLKGLVLLRNLPFHAGAAIVLTEPGAAFLRKNGIKSAVSGKDFGDVVNDEWFAPKWWKHDLAAAGFLSLLYTQGVEIFPERRLRRENPHASKFPDGIAIINGKIHWIEVENVRKTGHAMARMVQHLIAVATHNAPELSGMVATVAVVAYDPQARDENGHIVDHKLRVKAAFLRQIKQDVSVNFVALEISAFGVKGIKSEVEMIKSPEHNARSKMIKDLELHLGLRFFDKNDALAGEEFARRSQDGDFHLRYSKLKKEGGWCWKIEYDPPGVWLPTGWVIPAREVKKSGKCLTEEDCLYHLAGYLSEFDGGETYLGDI
jgi:hypothetical protein